MKTLDELLQTHKQCHDCKIYKLFDSFHTHNHHKDGLKSYCKECSSIRLQKFRKEVIYSNEKRHEDYKIQGMEYYKKRLTDSDYLIKRNEYSKNHKPSTIQRSAYNLLQRENRPV